MKDNNTHFCSDLHLKHFNILKYDKRPFATIEEHDEVLIENWNKVVKPNDTIYYLGDLCFGRREYAEACLKRLNGNKKFIWGNHDKPIISLYQKYGQYLGMKDIINIYGQEITLDHFSARVWNRCHHGAWMLYGHCLDLNTEILTKNGWKFRTNLSKTDEILSLNLSTNVLEYNNITEIVDYPDYTGKVYSLKSKGVDWRVTENHTMIDVNRNTGVFRKFLAKDTSNLTKRQFVKSGFLNLPDFNLSDNHIKLLVWIAADGNLQNSNLIQIRVKKQRKVERIKNLLEQLSLKYNESLQKDGSVCFNFNLPYELNNIRLKPISDIILLFSRNQLKVLLEEYSHTDGYYNKSTLIIYTSKKEESDIIQQACIQNGYTCNISSRFGHGFSKKISYELHITDTFVRIHQDLKEKVIVEEVQNEHFWCVKVPNGTIFIRRNGKPILTGNSHDNLEHLPHGKSMDVGVPSAYRILGEYRPFCFEEIKEIMDKREIVVLDHHR